MFGSNAFRVPKGHVSGFIIRISNTVRLFAVRGSGKERAKGYTTLVLKSKFQRVMVLMVFTFDQCQNLEFIPYATEIYL